MFVVSQKSKLVLFWTLNLLSTKDSLVWVSGSLFEIVSFEYLYAHVEYHDKPAMVKCTL